jgi:DNA-binding transcriptional ArsR family regulator
MSRRRSVPAPAFAALGDETRLSLVARLAREAPCSISRLSEGSRITRQAVTKHLRVLERAGLVRGVRTGRECRFELAARPLKELRDYLEEVSRQWDDALQRLKAFVERDAGSSIPSSRS